MAEEEATEAAALPADVTPISMVALWVSEMSRRRLSDRLAVEISTDMDDVSAATDVVLISTRLPVVRLRPVMNVLHEAGPKTIVVLCHPGGEDIALNLVEQGANSIVAEGNETGLATAYPDSVLDEAPADEDGFIATADPIDPELLLTGFRQRLEMSGPRESELGVESVSGLPSGAAFDRMLTDKARRGNLPRVGHIEFVNGEVMLDSVDVRTVNLVSRRLSLLLDGACASAGAQLFALGNLHYAFLADDLLDEEADQLGEQIIAIGESFRPDGVESLRAAVGHAGPDVGDNDRTLVELAARASDAARRRGGGMVNAGKLTADEAVEVELNAAFEAVERIEELSGGEHHGAAVSELAVELAGELGYYHVDVLRVRLAAQLHDIGKFGLAPELIRAEENELSGDDLEAWKAHPQRGADYLRFSGGADIADAVLHHHESWDGSGFPEGLSGEDIPLDARVIAVVDAAVRLLGELPRDEVVEALRERAGTAFDPSVVEAFAVMSAKQLDVGESLAEL